MILEANVVKQKERLGRAWVDLNCGVWGEFIGEKPKNYDELPEYSEDNSIETQFSHLIKKMDEIENEIGSAATSRYWWKYQLSELPLP